MTRRYKVLVTAMVEVEVEPNDDDVAYDASIHRAARIKAMSEPVASIETTLILGEFE